MARTTDTERGARLAYEIAQVALQDLFPELPRSFWEEIADEASVTIAECSWSREAMQ